MIVAYSCVYACWCCSACYAVQRNRPKRCQKCRFQNTEGQGKVRMLGIQPESRVGPRVFQMSCENTELPTCQRLKGALAAANHAKPGSRLTTTSLSPEKSEKMLLGATSRVISERPGFSRPTFWRTILPLHPPPPPPRKTRGFWREKTPEIDPKFSTRIFNLCFPREKILTQNLSPSFRFFWHLWRAVWGFCLWVEKVETPTCSS